MTSCLLSKLISKAFLYNINSIILSFFNILRQKKKEGDGVIKAHVYFKLQGRLKTHLCMHMLTYTQPRKH